MWGFPMPDYLEEGGITFLLQRGGHLLLANLGDDGLVVHGGEGEGGAGARSCPPRLGPPGKGGGGGRGAGRGGGGGQRARGGGRGRGERRRKLCYNMEFPPHGFLLQTWNPDAVSRNPLKGQCQLRNPNPLSPPPPSQHRPHPAHAPCRRSRGSPLPARFGGLEVLEVPSADPTPTGAQPRSLCPHVVPTPQQLPRMHHCGFLSLPDNPQGTRGHPTRTRRGVSPFVPPQPGPVATPVGPSCPLALSNCLGRAPVGSGAKPRPCAVPPPTPRRHRGEKSPHPAGLAAVIAGSAAPVP